MALVRALCSVQRVWSEESPCVCLLHMWICSTDVSWLPGRQGLLPPGLFGSDRDMVTHSSIWSSDWVTQGKHDAAQHIAGSFVAAQDFRTDYTQMISEDVAFLIHCTHSERCVVEIRSDLASEILPFGERSVLVQTQVKWPLVWLKHTKSTSKVSYLLHSRLNSKKHLQLTLSNGPKGENKSSALLLLILQWLWSNVQRNTCIYSIGDDE